MDWERALSPDEPAEKIIETVNWQYQNESVRCRLLLAAVLKKQDKILLKIEKGQ